MSYISRDTPQTASFTFSTRLRNVEWSERNYGATRSEAVKSLLGSISSGAAITWDYENPICMCFQQNLGPLRAQYGATVDTFKNLAIGTRVKILTKASKSLVSQVLPSSVRSFSLTCHPDRVLQLLRGATVPNSAPFLSVGGSSKSQ